MNGRARSTGTAVALRTLLLSVVLLVTACAGSPAPAGDEPPSNDPSAPSTSASSTTAPVLSSPEPDPELATLLAVAPTGGNQIAGRVAAQPGELWISMNCLGTGELVLEFDPLDAFTFACQAGEVLTTKNQLNLQTAHELTLSVTASAEVTWSVLVQQ